MASLVVVRYIKLHTNFLCKVGSTTGTLSSLLIFVPVALGVSASFQLSILNLFRMSLTYLC